MLFVAMAVPFTGTAQLWQNVNPMIGTGGHGHTFPGATTPFGMVQLSPDTRIDGSWDGCSGYHYSDSFIYGFSHTHLSGTGVSDYGDVLLMPFLGAISFDPKVYGSAFSHTNEKATAGHYAVTLADDGIGVALTATGRTGFHQYQFPASKQANIMLDLRHRDELLDADVVVTGKTTLEGFRISKAWARQQHVYFVMEFSRPFKVSESLKAGMGNSKVANRTVATALSFDTRKDQQVEVRVGISFTSIEGARKNLEAESKGRSFQQLTDAARNAWEAELGRVRVNGASTADLRIFYTALYHTMIHPNIATDVDGLYRGHNQQIQKAEGYQHYTVFSLWDTFRATHPLYNLIMPERSRDFVLTLLAIGAEENRLPVWELAANETDCMIGIHGTSVIADAWAKGVRDFDTGKALELMLASTRYTRFGLPEFHSTGMLTVDDESESVSRMLEYAYDDWCIATFAREMGKTDVSGRFMELAQVWKNTFDPVKGFMRPRQNGAWLEPFDPAEVNNHFTEANSWQYSFFVPHDVYGLVDAMEGPERFEKQLDALFTASSKTTGRDQADITGLIGQYAHGNEPSHHVAFLYNYIRKPAKTQVRVRQIISSFYSDAPDGLIGNEDCGQMSAWYVFAAMGMYPVCPGSEIYALSAPLFSQVVVNAHTDKPFTIAAQGAGRNNPYAHHPKLDGTAHTFFLTHTELLGAKELRFEMTDAAGQVQEVNFHQYNASQLLDESLLITPAPVFRAQPAAFTDSMRVSIWPPEFHGYRFATLEYRINQGEWQAYRNPFRIYETAAIEARAHKNGKASAVVRARYVKRPNNFLVTVNSRYNPQYSAGGAEGLVDGILGDENWRKGNWMGVQGEDLVAVVDMKSARPVKRVSLRFLSDQRSWIFLPSLVHIEVSTNGSDWRPLQTLKPPLDTSDESTVFSLAGDSPLPQECRFVRVTATNFGKLPESHPGRGGDAFIFIDEITIE
jgi:predicted alpha-1,2-mannosidase